MGRQSEAPRAKARGITRKLGQPGVKDAIHPRSKERGILACFGKKLQMQGLRILRNEAYLQYAAMTKDEA
jgi:hypothetical protein